MSSFCPTEDRSGKINQFYCSPWPGLYWTIMFVLQLPFLNYEIPVRTCDTWHVTCHTWRKVKILSKFQVLSPNGLGVKVELRLGGKGQVIYWMNHYGVCRTAPASLGLLIMVLPLRLQSIETLWIVSRYSEQLPHNWQFFQNGLMGRGWGGGIKWLFAKLLYILKFKTKIFEQFVKLYYRMTKSKL